MGWNVGDLVRYGEGPSALMRIGAIHDERAHGRGFHSTGICTSRHVDELVAPSTRDRFIWFACHDDNDAWIPGRWGSLTPEEQAEFDELYEA